MNKTERSKLALIVAQMIYSHESSFEVVTVGKSILKNCPSIATLVESYHFSIACSNVISAIKHETFDRAFSNSFGRADVNQAEHLKETISQELSEIFDEYLDNFSGAECTAYLFELEAKCIEPTLAHETLHALLSAPLWIDAVKGAFEEGSAEFQYLIIV